MIGAVAWVAIGAAAFFVVHTEQQILDERAAVRAFDLHAREAVDALAEVRAGQQAYVAAGQGVAFWMPKVAARLDTATEIIAGLRQKASGANARAALSEAAGTVADFGDVDKRARDYIRSGQQLMAADVVFTEGGQTTANAARQVETARLAEHQALDWSEAAKRKTEAMAMAGAGLCATLVILLLGVLPARAGRSDSAEGADALEPAEQAAGDTLMLREAPRTGGAPVSSSASARAVSPVLKAAADLCTDFGRVKDLPELTQLLGRGADLMDASGLVVWLGSAAGADMRPVLAYGYSAQALARLPDVPRGANNAAAAAYRSGGMQIVLSRPGSASGAIVAPLLAPEGCIGALSAEIRSGGEVSDSVQALATLFAAQLAGALGATQAVEHRAAGNM
jgi:hypothetical protein